MSQQSILPSFTELVKHIDTNEIQFTNVVHSFDPSHHSLEDIDRLINTKYNDIATHIQNLSSSTNRMASWLHSTPFNCLLWDELSASQCHNFKQTLPQNFFSLYHSLSDLNNLLVARHHIYNTTTQANNVRTQLNVTSSQHSSSSRSSWAEINSTTPSVSQNDLTPSPLEMGRVHHPVSKQDDTHPTEGNQSQCASEVNTLAQIRSYLQTPKSSASGTKLTTSPKKRSAPVRKKNQEFSYCVQCACRDTPEWRKGPDGTRCLCNACGLFYAKLVRKHNQKIASIILQVRKALNNTEVRTLPNEFELNAIIEKYNQMVLE